MAKDNNLQDFLTDIADAIREKKGTTEKINPQDFATEIANLSSGGGSGSGSGDQYSYYRVNHNADYYDPGIISCAYGFSLVKGALSDTASIYDGDICIGLPDFFSKPELIIAVCGTALPIKFKDKIIDYGDWKHNYAESIANIKGGGDEPEPEIEILPDEPPVVEIPEVPEIPEIEPWVQPEDWIDLKAKIERHSYEEYPYRIALLLQ